MRRYDCLKNIVSLLKDKIVVTNIGGVAVEWYNLCDQESNFYLWHSLGMATSIGFGIACSLPHRDVIVFEGDGSLLMNLGGLCTIGNELPANLKIITFDNESYESPGGYKTATRGKANLANIAKEAGIKKSLEVKTLKDFEEIVQQALDEDSTYFINAKVEPGTANVEDPTMDGKENKYRFIRYIERTENISIFKSPGHVTKSR